MSTLNVAIIVGSLRKDSMNLKLAKALAALGAGKFETAFLSIADLPLFSQDLEAHVPAPVTALKNGIAKADAVLIVTPEYNRSMPGPLKNAVDWASRPYGNNSFAGKPVAVCGASGGSIGTACAQSSLAPVLRYLDVQLMGQPEVYLHFTDGMIDAGGAVSSDSTKKFLQTFVDSFAVFIEHHRKIAA